MDKIKRFIEKYYVWIVILIIAIAFARVYVENTKTETLMPWDNWNLAVMAKVIDKNEGKVPSWIDIQEYPEGAPFLYPPLIPLLFSVFSAVTKISILSIIKFLGFLMYPALVFSVLL